MGFIGNSNWGKQPTSSDTATRAAGTAVAGKAIERPGLVGEEQIAKWA